MPTLGFVLSGSTTQVAYAQLTSYGEAHAREGMLVGIRSSYGTLLARIDRMRFESPAFRVGDPWGLARREGADLRSIATAIGMYCVAELSILGRIGDTGLEEVYAPPKPGDSVIDLSELSEPEIFGLRRNYGIVWIERLAGYSELKVPLDVEALTMHLGVFGETGSGKSYTMGYLIEKLSSIPTPKGPRALPTIVVDANGDYLDMHEAYSKSGKLGAFSEVLRLVFPTSRFARKPFTKAITIDLDELDPRDLATLVVAYRFGSPEASELQLHAITRLFESAQDKGVGINELMHAPSYMDKLVDEVCQELQLHHQTARAMRSALSKFRHDIAERFRLVPRESPKDAKGRATLSREFIEQLTKSPSLAIIDFSPDGAPGVPLIVKQFVIAYLATLLYDTFTEYKLRGNERYLLFVIEEAQNYVPNPRTYPIGFSVAREKISLIATQGRKFGICLAIVSQRPAFIDPVVLSMINSWFIHRVAPEDASYISRICGGLPPSLESKLPKLPRGTCVFMGQLNPLGTPLLLKIGRRAVSHKMGRTALVDTLAELSS
ncbi:MAG: ATP-binding protein [Crenarchaeota archaeon]|nr:ATP-binding protein [Thermoproteota archaeon]